MGYTIMRTAKLKTKGSIGGSTDHTFRESETTNADPEKLGENKHTGANSSAEVLEKMEARWATQTKINKKGETVSSIRKNAVLAIEYLITHSHDYTNSEGKTPSENGYFSDALKYLHKKHGSENVISAHIHNDETTPHMVVYVVPIDQKGKLNCREFLGGAKKLNEFQTDFHNEVGAKQGLERGVERTGAKHTSIREYYGQLAKGIDQEKVATPSIFDYAMAATGIKPKIVKRQESQASKTSAAMTFIKTKERQLHEKMDYVDYRDEELESKSEELVAMAARIAAEQREIEKILEENRVNTEKMGILASENDKLTKNNTELNKELKSANRDIENAEQHIDRLENPDRYKFENKFASANTPGAETNKSKPSGGMGM